MKELKILDKFKGFKIAYHKEKKNTLKDIDKDSLPELIIYDNKNAIAFFNCSSNPINSKKLDVKEKYDTKEGNIRLYSHLRYFNLLNKIVNKNQATIIMNLFFDIHKKFNKFHIDYWYKLIPGSKLLHCGILCNAKDKLLMENTLKFLYSSYNLNKPFKEEIKKEDLGDYAIFWINIVVFYHVTNARLFAYNIIRKRHLLENPYYRFSMNL